MSVKVDLSELAGHVDSYGFAYLLTVGEDLRAHAVAVRPVLTDGRLEVEGLGRTTRANLEARPEVSLVWPPVEEGGYSLIVDGRATTTDQGLSLEPGHAILHRPAAGPPEPDAAAADCGNDCVPVAQADS